MLPVQRNPSGSCSRHLSDVVCCAARRMSHVGRRHKKASIDNKFAVLAAWPRALGARKGGYSGRSTLAAR